jgi:cytochrome c oxidase subunit IV
MAGEEADVMLVILVHAATLWDDVADVFMVLLQPALLVRSIGVAVEACYVLKTRSLVQFLFYIDPFR